MPDNHEAQPLTFSAEEREHDEFSRSWHVVFSDGNDIVECGSEDHARWIARALTMLERAHEPTTAMIEAGDAASAEEYGSLATSVPIGRERVTAIWRAMVTAANPQNKGLDASGGQPA